MNCDWEEFSRTESNRSPQTEKRAKPSESYKNPNVDVSQ